MMKRLGALATAAAVIGIAPIARAQTPVTGWRPLKTASEWALDTRIPRAALDQTRRQVEQLLAIIKAAAAEQATQVELRPEYQLNLALDGSYRADLRIYVYPPLPNTQDEEGKPRRVPESSLDLSINTLDELCTGHCREVFLEPPVRERIAGFPVYAVDRHGTIRELVIAKRDQPLFVPVSQKAMIDPQIREWRAKLDTLRRDGVPPEGQSLLIELATALEERLAAMSPAERSAQAWGGCVNDDQTTHLCTPQDEGARPYVRYNPSFFDRTAPKTAFQLVSVHWSRPPNRNTPVGRCIMSLWESVDWTAVQALLR
jgi:hypothetical protein